jgi:hypothetical protein
LGAWPEGEIDGCRAQGAHGRWWWWREEDKRSDQKSPQCMNFQEVTKRAPQLLPILTQVCFLQVPRACHPAGTPVTGFSKTQPSSKSEAARKTRAAEEVGADVLGSVTGHRSSWGHTVLNPGSLIMSFLSLPCTWGSKRQRDVLSQLKGRCRTRGLSLPVPKTPQVNDTDQGQLSAT